MEYDGKINGNNASKKACGKPPCELRMLPHATRIDPGNAII